MKGELRRLGNRLFEVQTEISTSEDGDRKRRLRQEQYSINQELLSLKNKIIALKNQDEDPILRHLDTVKDTLKSRVETARSQAVRIEQLETAGLGALNFYKHVWEDHAQKCGCALCSLRNVITSANAGNIKKSEKEVSP